LLDIGEQGDLTSSSALFISPQRYWQMNVVTPQDLSAGADFLAALNGYGVWECRSNFQPFIRLPQAVTASFSRIDHNLTVGARFPRPYNVVNSIEKCCK